MKYYGVAMSEYDKNRIQHFGIKGQKWGIRRYQNEDGTLTEEGKKRYTYTTGLPGERKMSLVGRIKFGNKYSNEFNAQNKYKGNAKEYEAKERQKFDEMTEQENKMRELGNQMKDFDKASADEKFKIIDNVLNKSHELYKQGGHDADKMRDGLMDWYWQNYSKAGKARFDEYDKLPDGPERDKKLTQLLKDSKEHGQDSEYLNALIGRMQDKHGDFLSGQFKSDTAKSLAQNVGSADEEETRIRREYYQKDQKLGKYPKDKYSSGWEYQDQLKKDHPEVKRASEKREAAWVKYCEQVLKDMNMPINDETIEYIQSVIIWN